MGARPMQRLIQDTIRRALADELLFGRLIDGGRLTVDIDDKERGASRHPSAAEERGQGVPRRAGGAGTGNGGLSRARGAPAPRKKRPVALSSRPFFLSNRAGLGQK